MLGVKILSLLLLVAVSTEALDCNCNRETCVEPVGCKGGIVPDVCHCCRRCAKVLNESCGGPWDITGVCDQGLTCDKPVSAEAERAGEPDDNDEGTCKPKKSEA